MRITHYHISQPIVMVLPMATILWMDFNHDTMTPWTTPERTLSELLRCTVPPRQLVTRYDSTRKRYPLVNFHITMEHHYFAIGKLCKTHYFDGHFQYMIVILNLPEGSPDDLHQLRSPGKA